MFKILTIMLDSYFGYGKIQRRRKVKDIYVIPAYDIPAFYYFN